jgi:hypothetical protein
MPYVDDAVETMTEDLWQDIEYDRHMMPAPAAPAEGRITGFLNSLTASMALLRRPAHSVRLSKPALSASENLAQNYPYLYIRVMCG